MADTIKGADVAAALQRASQTLVAQADYLTKLDQAIGDGDMGVTMRVIGEALLGYVDENEVDDIGQYLAKAGMLAEQGRSLHDGYAAVYNAHARRQSRAARPNLTAQDLAEMFVAADEGVAERGKANLGDKTIRDALTPAQEAFSSAIAEGASLNDAYARALDAAKAGRDSVTPQRSKVGRAGWVGERTEGQVDPGCEMLVLVMESVVQA